jgi:DnaK suppressor protein
MDTNRARKLLLGERAQVESLLKNTREASAEDRDAEAITGDLADRAQPLTTMDMDDSIAEQLEERLARIDRALKRVEDGSYGLSVRSGEPIPDERLEADPAAELTIEEARAGR